MPTPGWLLLLVALLSPAALAVELPEPDGRTVWVEGSLGQDGAFEVEVRGAARGWVWLELDGPDGGPDLDLLAEPAQADGERRRATSHLADEMLLVEVDPARPLLVRVVASSSPASPSGVAGAGFRVGATPLSITGELTPAEPRPLRGVLDAQGGPAARAHLIALGPWDWDAARLHARRTEGTGDLDLVVFDGRHEAVGIALDDGPDERCQPLDASGHSGSDDDAASPRFALLLSRDGPATYELRVERPEQGQKAFPASSLERFLRDLGSTPEQRRALDALRRTPDFQRIRLYMEAYPGGLPLRLRAVPGLRAGGVERFGTYSRGTLTINPTIPAHRENVQELLDTLVHELVHALLDLPRGPRFPFGLDVLDAAHDPRLEVLDLPIRRGGVAPGVGDYLDRNYGPSASDPLRDYSDINAGAQRLIVKVIEETLVRTGLGRETIVFESVRGRAGSAR